MSKDPLIQAVTPATKWYVVLRPFDGDKRFVRGEVVDTSGWPHLIRLEELRYIAPLPHGAEVPQVDKDGVRLISLDGEQAKTVPEKKRPTPTRKETASA